MARIGNMARWGSAKSMCCM